MTQSLGPAGQTRSDPMTRYLLELAGTASVLAGVQALAERARRTAVEVTREGTRVRFLRVVFVPEDGSCFLLYEAESEEAIGKAVARAEIGVRRVARTLAPVGRPTDDDKGEP